MLDFIRRAVWRSLFPIKYWPFCSECGRFFGSIQCLHGVKHFYTKEWTGMCKKCADKHGDLWSDLTHKEVWK